MMKSEKELFRLVCSVNREGLGMFYADSTVEKMEELKQEYYNSDTCIKQGSNIDDFYTFLKEHNIEVEGVSINEIVF